MQLQLDYDTQDMIISLERIDVDYKRVTKEQSAEIRNFIGNILHLLSPKVLSVIIRDIETELETLERHKKYALDTKYNTDKYISVPEWKGIEHDAVVILENKYNISCLLRGLYTEFINPDKHVQYDKFNHTVKIDDDTFDKFLKSAFIYAFGRHTYVVDTTVKYLIKFKPHLSQDTISYILNCIEDEKARIDNEDSSKPWHYICSTDLEQWLELYDALKN